MDKFIENAFDSIRKIGVDLKHCKIGNIEAADKICETLCEVVAYYYGGKAAEETQAVKKDFEV